MSDKHEHLFCESLTLYTTRIDNPNVKIKAVVLSVDPNGGRITVYNRREKAVVQIRVDDNGVASIDTREMENDNNE